jgi:hypothetical protein
MVGDFQECSLVRRRKIAKRVIRSLGFVNL